MRLLDIAAASLMCGLLLVIVGRQEIKRVLRELFDDILGEPRGDERLVGMRAYAPEQHEVGRRPR